MERAELQAVVAPLIDTIDELGEAVAAVAAEQARRDADTKAELEKRARESRGAERRQVRRIRWLGVGMVLVLIGMALVAFSALTSRTILDRVESVTGPSARRMQAESTKRLLDNLTEEIDCRHRRAQVRLPAPADPAQSCRSQTDPAVYPGIPGQPPR